MSKDHMLRVICVTGHITTSTGLLVTVLETKTMIIVFYDDKGTFAFCNSIIVNIWLSP